MIIANYRYPESGNAEATGKNVIELALQRTGAKVKRVQVITTSPMAEVRVNGHKIRHEYGYGDRWVYEHSHICQHMGGISGGIESLTVNGNARFYAFISV